MGWRHTHSDSVRFGDLDAMRHLNNVAFLTFFESARIAYIGTLIPAHDPSDPDDFGLIFAECHINYRSPGQYGEQIDTRLRPARVERSAFRIEFEMRVGERLLAEGYGVLVAYDYTAGRATALPAALRELLQAEACAA